MGPGDLGAATAAGSLGRGRGGVGRSGKGDGGSLWRRDVRLPIEGSCFPLLSSRWWGLDRWLEREPALI